MEGSLALSVGQAWALDLLCVHVYAAAIEDHSQNGGCILWQLEACV